MKTADLLPASFMFSVTVFCGALLASGVNCKVDDDGGTSADSGGEACACPAGKENAMCICITGLDDQRCWTSEGACDDWCNSETSLGHSTYTVLSCQNYPDEGTCSGWDPAGEITLTSGVYYMDAGWVGSIAANPAPTWTCDDAYLDDRNGGKFTVKLASSGELLYELGLRNNDIPQTINGMALNNVDDAAAAFVTLYVGGEDSYDLYVKRGSNFIHLYWQLFFTLEGP